MLRWAPHEPTIQRALKNGMLVSAWAQRMRDAVCAMRACGALASSAPGIPSAAAAELGMLRDVADHALDLCRQMEAAGSSVVSELTGGAPRTCHLTDQLREAARLISGVVAPTVRLRLAVDEHPMHLSVPPADAQHVMLTLLLHARDAVAEGGCVDVRLWPEIRDARGEARLRLSVDPRRETALAIDQLRAEVWWRELSTQVRAWGGALEVADRNGGSGRVWHLRVPLAQGAGDAAASPRARREASA